MRVVFDYGWRWLGFSIGFRTDTPAPGEAWFELELLCLRISVVSR